MATTSTTATPVSKSLRGRLRALTSDRLTRNMGWYGLAEAANRGTRLITAIITARILLPEDFGIAATALVVSELVGLIAMTGIGQAVVRARDDELASVLNTARRAATIAAITAAAIQVAIGATLAAYTGRPELFAMLTLLAAVYPLLPSGQMQAHLIVRANRLHVLAGIAVVQVAVDNLLTAALALSGFGAWAVVLPKLLTAPIWVLGMRRAQSWSHDASAGYAPMRPLAKFATTVIGSDLVVAARHNLDKVLVGAILGIEALGIYWFVFNAGIGFSLSLTSSLAASAYPHLAELSDRPREMLDRYDDLIWRAALPVACVIALQAVLAPLYVPVVFGDRWAAYAVLVAALCLSAVAKPAFDCACQLLRAVGRPRTELFASMLLTVISLATLAVALPHGLAFGVLAFATMTALTQFVAAAAIRRSVGHRLRHDEPPLSPLSPAVPAHDPRLASTP